jgi:hypothetical protein
MSTLTAPQQPRLGRVRSQFRSHRRAGVVILTAAGLLVAGSSAVFAASTPRSPQAGGALAKPSLVHADAVTASVCNGGALKRSLVRFSNDPQIISGATPVNLLASPVVINGPATGTDTVLVTLTAETQLRGNTDGSQFDWIEGILTVDGVAITDVGSSELALTGSSTYSSNAAQACVTVGPGAHLLRVQAAVKTNGTSVGETGWIDDLVLRADVLN